MPQTRAFRSFVHDMRPPTLPRGFGPNQRDRRYPPPAESALRHQYAAGVGAHLIQLAVSHWKRDDKTLRSDAQPLLRETGVAHRPLKKTPVHPINRARRDQFFLTSRPPFFLS